MTTPDPVREAFEKWAKSPSGIDFDRYVDESAESVAWKAWQAALSAPPPQVPEKLWLWKNGDHYWAFRHLYPCFSPGGDPMTLGEPIGFALLKHSYDRAASPPPNTPREE